MALCTPDCLCVSCGERSQEFAVTTKGGGFVEVCAPCLRMAVYWGRVFTKAPVRVEPLYQIAVVAGFDAEGE